LITTREYAKAVKRKGRWYYLVGQRRRIVRVPNTGQAFRAGRSHPTRLRSAAFQFQGSSFTDLTTIAHHGLRDLEILARLGLVRMFRADYVLSPIEMIEDDEATCDPWHSP
jgi:hypothetical protein